MTQWYYSDYQRNRHGPVSGADLAMLHANGQLADDTLVWREGLAQWQPWHAVAGEMVAATPQPAPARASFATASTDAPADAFAGPYTVAEPRSPYAPPRAPVQRAADVYLDGEVVYAGFWKRVAANLIDSVIIGLLGMVIGAAIGGLLGAAFGLGGGLDTGGAVAIQGIVQLLSLVLTASYYGWFYTSVQQATPGKMAIGIKVVRSDGEGCSFWRGFGRYFAMFLSGVILCIGFLMAAFTARKQCLHDMICDTVVVDRWAFTAYPDQQREELGTLTVVVLVLGGLLFVGLVLVLMAGLAAIAGAGR
ncbi:RDD family protein [Luteimonas sp. 22616]|uniref:RDD family protein n=1 Tax=Luteimonas sp. 22616 TaxID=3453951 RepID=UPI003F84D264